MVTHRNIVANLEQVFSDYFEEYGKLAPSDTTPVSWLPFYHDMGLLLGVFAPVAAGMHAVVTSPMAFSRSPTRWIQIAGQPHPVGSQRRRTSLTNWRRDGRPMSTWPDAT